METTLSDPNFNCISCSRCGSSITDENEKQLVGSEIICLACYDKGNADVLSMLKNAGSQSAQPTLVAPASAPSTPPDTGSIAELIEKQKKELQEQQHHRLDLEKRMEENEGKKVELSQQAVMLQQYREGKESSFTDTLKAMAEVTSAVAPLVLEAFKYLGQGDKDHNRKLQIPIVGKYELVNNGNFDEYLRAIGIGWIQRCAVTSSWLTVVISEKDGRYLIDMQATVGSDSLSFLLGKEFCDTTIDGYAATNLVTREANQLIHVQTLHNAARSKRVTTREFTEHEMIVTLEANGVTATRTFKRIE